MARPRQPASAAAWGRRPACLDPANAAGGGQGPIGVAGPGASCLGSPAAPRATGGAAMLRSTTSARQAPCGVGNERRTAPPTTTVHRRERRQECALSCARGGGGAPRFPHPPPQAPTTQAPGHGTPVPLLCPPAPATGATPPQGLPARPVDGPATGAVRRNCPAAQRFFEHLAGARRAPL